MPHRANVSTMLQEVDTRLSLGQDAEALALLEAARGVAEQSGSSLLLEILFRLGDLHLSLGDPSRAADPLEHAVELAQNEVANDPRSEPLQRNLALCYDRLCDVRVATGEREEAKDLAEWSLSIYQRIAGRRPDDGDAQEGLAAAYERAAAVTPDDADLWFGHALVIRRARHERLATAGTALALAVGLIASGEHAGDAGRIQEGADLLIDLRARGLLDPQYFPVLDQLGGAGE